MLDGTASRTVLTSKAVADWEQHHAILPVTDAQGNLEYRCTGAAHKANTKQHKGSV